MGEYEPRWESLDSHPLPDWFRDAKLGIFIHWGIYSVPAWAPPNADIGGEKASPYAEWYPYYMHKEGSPTKEYHQEEHGENVEYIDFVEGFTAEGWDPEKWATLFSDVGAGYVVLTGEHHDGFPLWESHYTKYNAVEMGPERDLVGDLSDAVRDRDLRFAASFHANYNYYQPGFEGAFGHPDYEPGGPSENRGGPGPEYVDFMNAKHREVIRKYDPDLLWFDVPKADSEHVYAKELIADYYNRAAKRDQEVAVNDRASTDALGPTIDLDGDRQNDQPHGDFVTPEYASFDEIQDEPWECCRGIGHSFGYNAAEDKGDHLSGEELVHSFVDVVSKNGNLLLNIGPRADGTIPELQREPLVALGSWLDINNEAIFASRPWVVAEDDISEIEVRYTHRDGTLYATLLTWPDDEVVSLSIPEHVGLDKSIETTLLTKEGQRTLDMVIEGEKMAIELGKRPDHKYAYTLALTNVSNPRKQ